MANPTPQTKGGKPDKLIRDALIGAIRQSPEKLKKAAERVLDEAAEGSISHMQFMADRVDGKAIQPISHSVTDEPHDESQLDAEIRQLAGKIGLALSSKEKTRTEDEAELSNLH